MNNQLNDKSMNTVTGGAAQKYAYTFYTGELIWATAGKTSYYRVDTGISTNEYSDQVSITVYFKSDWYGTETITMSAGALNDCRNNNGHAEP